MNSIGKWKEGPEPDRGSVKKVNEKYHERACTWNAILWSELWSREVRLCVCGGGGTRRNVGRGKKSRVLRSVRKRRVSRRRRRRVIEFASREKKASRLTGGGGGGNGRCRRSVRRPGNVRAILTCEFRVTSAFLAENPKRLGNRRRSVGRRVRFGGNGRRNRLTVVVTGAANALTEKFIKKKKKKWNETKKKNIRRKSDCSRPSVAALVDPLSARYHARRRSLLGAKRPKDNSVELVGCVCARYMHTWTRGRERDGTLSTGRGGRPMGAATRRHPFSLRAPPKTTVARGCVCVGISVRV